SLARPGGARALEAQARVLPDRIRVAPPRAHASQRSGAARARVPPRGLPGSSAQGMVSADLANEPDVRGGRPRSALVARHGRAVVPAPQRQEAPGREPTGSAWQAGATAGHTVEAPAT